MRLPCKMCTAVVFLALATVLLNGCVSRPKEQASPGELFIIGQEDLKAERFESARQAFQRLLREYPDSKHRRDALLSLADAYYKSEEYIEARVQYAEYVQLYPVSALTPKAYFYLAMSDYNRRLAPDREQAVARDALKNFQELIRRFPRSEYSSQAKEKSEELRNLLARHELFIALFYFRKGLRVSAIPRLQTIIKDYIDQPEIRAEAMYYLGESYMGEQSYQKAGGTYKNLIKDYPASRFAVQAYNRLVSLTSEK